MNPMVLDDTSVFELIVGWQTANYKLATTMQIDLIAYAEGAVLDL